MDVETSEGVGTLTVENFLLALVRQTVVALLPVVLFQHAHADVASAHGLDDLIERIGLENIPTGAGVVVGQVEVADESGRYSPDTEDERFVGKTFYLQSGASGVLNHATQVGLRVYGIHNVGIAQDVDTIHAYSAVGWTQSDYLQFGSSGNPTSPPSNLELFNNSWIASFGSTTYDQQVLARGDYAVDTHNVMMLNGVANSDEHVPLMCFGFNGVSVGMENGEHLAGTIPAGFDQSGMQIPVIVAAQNSTSNATGVVSAITALLAETRDSHPNTSGNFFAGFSETMKTVLLGGAAHLSGWTNNADSTGANRGYTDQPIDETVGVGTVNIDRSHKILTAGQFSSSASLANLETAPTAGWDTTTLSYGQQKHIKFQVNDIADEVVITLVWHQKANSGFSGYTIFDLNLELRKYNNGKPLTLVGDAGVGVFGSGNVVSASTVDNIEHLYIQNLVPGEYVLTLSRDDASSGSAVFGLSWLFPDNEGGVPGDLNGDGVVEVNDLLVIIAAWGPCSGDCPADLSGDGIVDVSDILLLLSYWS